MEEKTIFDRIEKYWPNIVVNNHVLHFSSRILREKTSLHAKWDEKHGLLICQSDILKSETINTLSGIYLNLVLKDESCEK